MGTWEGRKEKLPIKNDEKSSFVAEYDQISNLELIVDINKILEFILSKVPGI